MWIKNLKIHKRKTVLKILLWASHADIWNVAKPSSALLRINEILYICPLVFPSLLRDIISVLKPPSSFFGNFHNQLNSFLKCTHSLNIIHNFLWAPHFPPTPPYIRDLKLLLQKSTLRVQEMSSTCCTTFSRVTLLFSFLASSLEE